VTEALAGQRVLLRDDEKIRILLEDTEPADRADVTAQLKCIYDLG
jgi:hypothetical protein